MATAETWEFGSIQNKSIIDDAYERIGILPSILTSQQVKAAIRSLNFIMQSWINRGLNLWTVKQGMLALTPNQTAYALPNHGIDILEATVRTSVRNLGGTAATSAGGTASYAFDNNTNTACTQVSANGNISYNWGSALYAISMVGVQSATTITYTLVGEYSLNGTDWTRALSMPAQTYTESVISWFVPLIPIPSNYFRVRETDGATLNIEELFFNTNINDRTITRCSRSEYIAYPNKSQPGTPSNFWVNRQVEPIVCLYPTPNPLYNNMYYTFTQTPQDVGAMINTLEIPPRFLEALTSDLAARLAVKEQKMDLIPILKSLADEEYKTAGEEDRERVPLRIYPNHMEGWTQS